MSQQTDGKLYNSALRFLTRRPRSEKEVCDNLKKRKATEEQIEKILQKLRDLKFVNDREFANWWIESRLRFRPRSWKILKIELMQKGIDKELIEELRIQEEAKGTGQEEEQIKKLIDKKLPRVGSLSRQEIYKKVGGFLLRKGYEWETVKSCIDEVLRK